MLTRLTASELAAKLRAREVSAVEVAQAHLEAIRAHDGKIGAFLHVAEEKAMAQAAKADEALAKGEGGPLTGVPIAIKDNMSTLDIPTTAASKILEGYIPPYNATVVEKVEQAGMVMLGKTNLDEFAMGSSTETSAYQFTHNPWNLECSPGGSSGGSAAAVAGDLAPLSLGSDTGGSIRQPAGLCGVVGFKPTYGRVSRYGLIAFGSSLDQIGPFARSVEDAALLSSVISGHDHHDSTSLPHAPISTEGLKDGSLKGKRFGLPKEMFDPSIDAGVLESVHKAIDALKAEGAEFEEISIPEIRLGVTTYYIIAPAEASSNLARFDGVRYGPRHEGVGHVGTAEKTRAMGFGHEVKTRILIGTYTLSAGYYDAYYTRAQQVRSMMTAGFNREFARFDGIVTPTSPSPAFKIGSMNDDPMALKILDYCTIPANMGGFPAISLNCGLTEGLPVGIQIIGPALEDERVFQLAYCFEQVLGASPRPPTA
ncbi:MAG: Asp-tRNA(Asn)/Glu-tRNA(Gln) amidotransferase subunit GatA [Fimbriimonadaceae bacterium]|nr:Asp-tRNA(Asn)/Glu-tRNA(Gln) amidotransferase subunit GatA [Fimbriimonadaceae bacterium]